MRGLYLTGPSKDIENPSEEYLRRMIFEFGAEFWDAGCGEMGINVSWPSWTLDEGPAGQPSIILFFEPNAGFFFQFLVPHGDTLVVYDGTSCDDLVAHYVGGEPFRVPRACCVSREMAWHIVKSYVDHREPSPLVNWVPFESLKYLDPEYG